MLEKFSLLINSLGKSLSAKCIAILCNYMSITHFDIKGVQKGKISNFNFFIFHPILMQFFFLQNDHLYGLLIDHEICWIFFLKGAHLFNILLSTVVKSCFAIQHCQWLMAGRLFSPGTPVSSTNKTKVVIKTTNQPESWFEPCSCVALYFYNFFVCRSPRNNLFLML